MKGIVFNLLEQTVADKYGQGTWERLLRTTGLEGIYTSLGSYPDEHLGSLVEAASSALGQPPASIVRWFGRAAIPLLARRYPEFFEEHTTTRPFLLSLNDIIHPEVRKIYPGADVPTFHYDTSSPDFLVMAYRSKRRLCAFAEGLIHGAADHYGEFADLNQPSCMLRGDDDCVFRISLRKSAEA